MLLIRKKLEKGKTISEIADDLEDTEENIVHLIEQFHLDMKLIKDNFIEQRRELISPLSEVD